MPSNARTAASHLLEHARRHGSMPGSPSALQQLHDGIPPPEVSARSGVPPAWVEGVRSFYDLLHGTTGPRVCVGTACSMAAGHQRGLPGEHAVCLGRCYEAPARTDRPGRPIPVRSLVEPPVVLRHVLGGTNGQDDHAVLTDAEAILRAVETSGLRGRGGAAYPTAAKWKVARDTQAPRRYVVANGDEGDPGAYVDRLLLEQAPHSVLAGMRACARVIRAGHGIVFIRGEYPAAQASMRAAIDVARARGWLGDEFDVEVLSGAGSYVAGEESALLRAIEGLRAEPSPKPPYPAQSGLHGMPTIVQNVETLALVPWVIAHHAAANAKALSISGAVKHPGVVEIRMGTSLRRVLDDGCGGRRGDAPWRLALIGGPLGCVVPATEFEQPLSYEKMPGLGHGGIVVLDETTPVRALWDHLLRFFASESCGNCAPCRLGTAQLARCADEASLQRVLETMTLGSLCGFGQGVARPLQDLLHHFRHEVFP